MFQRIRGAIDARIAEEQARQKYGPESLSRSSSAAGRLNNASPGGRPSSRLRRGDSLNARGPDPSEFDAEFIIGDDDSSTRASTPLQEPQKSGDGSSAGERGKEAGSNPAQSSHAHTLSLPGSPIGPELPTEARVKLRRLDKLEARYQELLKAYKVAHSRVLSIEPFEAALRENTPLASIGDPRAMTEYLNQISLKGDMVVEELKRVTSERDDYKKKLEKAESSTREAWDEIANLKRNPEAGGEKKAGSGDEVNGTALPSIQTSAPSEDIESSQKSPTASIASRTASIRNSLFSPKAASLKSPPAVEESEEFFSFDNEIPRLESELKDREQEVETLKGRVKTLTGDLSVARESTEGMANSLEAATRELTGLREGKERHGSELEAQKKTLEGQIASLESKLSSAGSEVEASKKAVDELKVQLNDKTDELERAKEQNKADKEQQTQEGEEQKSAEKRLKVLQDIVTALKSQLKDAESNVASLKEEVGAKEAEAKQYRRVVEFVDDGLMGNDKWKNAKDLLLKNESAEFDQILQSLVPTEAAKPAAVPTAPTQASPTTTTAGGKKKNKKKKKGGKAAMESPKQEPETLPDTNSQLASDAAPSDAVRKLEEQVQSLTSQLAEKEAAIERLHSKLKGEEGLREEIESLRDDLLNIGQDHVEAKDKIKELLAQKTALGTSIEKLEKELVELKTDNASASTDAEKAHKDLTAEFEDLKIKATALETDLSAAQQLAASRFKDLTEYRDALQKIQPELRNLRAESAELKSAKEDLKNKSAELGNLERMHEDLRSQVKDLKSAVTDKESDVRTLNQKVSQETNSRLKAEHALEVAQSDLRYSEGKKQEAIETNEQTLKDLAKAQDDLHSARFKVRELEEHVSKLNRDIAGLRDELQLKTAQYASAQSLMNSMRDQTSEMAMQVKEARERGESLDEELADAHRLLSERTREGETMRRLLSDVEMKADCKVRDFKERLEAAIEERDRAEDESNTQGRRRAREIEELKGKARDAERALKRIEEDKEELEHAQKDWKRRREELDAETERSRQELTEVRQAMSQLRDALDESEKQAREFEKEKAELRRSVEETTQRLERLRKTNKALSDDLKTVKSSRSRGPESGNRSPRSSIDSGAQRGVMSPTRKGSIARSETPTGQSGGIDHVYLKNVMLQFLEQKDKNHRKQLIPVLGMLLHFDSNDEQRWMSAISSK